MSDRVDVQPVLDRESARSLTDRIKASAEELWHMLLEAYEGGAHRALGYPSWGAYFEAEFGGHQSRGYQLIDASRVVSAVEEHSTNVERPNEAQARELAPLAKTQPEEAARVWGEVVEEARENGHQVTAERVREKLEKQRSKKIPDWTEEEQSLFKRMKAGETVVVNMRNDGHPNLVAWAKDAALFVRIDRRSEWGNPFEMPADGDRDAVVDNFEQHYLPYKPSLLNKREELRGGKALGCWCAPERCHGHTLKSWAGRSGRPDGPALHVRGRGSGSPARQDVSRA
jgi:hypothetical protein